MTPDLSDILWVVGARRFSCETHDHHRFVRLTARRDSEPPTPGHSKSGWVIDRFEMSNN